MIGRLLVGAAAIAAGLVVWALLSPLLTARTGPADPAKRLEMPR